MLEHLKNLKKQPLLRRIMVVVAVIVLYRLGAALPAAGVNGDLSSLNPSNQETLNLFNLFSGGPLTQVSIFALGITPFITAAIVMQLLESVIPSLKEKKRQGKAAAARVNSLTRLVGVGVALIQSFTTFQSLVNQGFASNGFFALGLYMVSTLAGFMLLLWLAELITRFGIGNGTTVLLVVSILSNVFVSSRTLLQTEGRGITAVVSLILVATALLLIFVLRSEVKIPIVHASRFADDTKHLSYLPFKLFRAGVTPIIFASSVLGAIAGVLSFTPLVELSQQLKDPTSWAFMIMTAILVVAFTRLYERTASDPVDVANDLMRESNFVPGVRPGWATVKLLEDVGLRLAAFSCLIGVPLALMHSWGLAAGIAVVPIAGTSLMIVVTMVLDIARQSQALKSLYSYEEIGKIKA